MVSVLKDSLLGGMSSISKELRVRNRDHILQLGYKTKNSKDREGLLAIHDIIESNTQIQSYSNE